MRNETLVKAFSNFAKAASFFESPFQKETMMQLITAIGYAENSKNPNTILMCKLLEAIGIDEESHDVKDCIEGNVY